MTKRNTFLLTFAGLLAFLISMHPVGFKVCNDAAYDCRMTADLLQMILSVFPFVFFLSLITYKMPEEVFRAWWRYAVWFVPLIMIVTYLLYGGHEQSGFGGVAQGAFYATILIVLYTIFIITSLIRIIVAYHKTKE